MTTTERYESVRKLLYQICHEIKKKYAGDWDEWFSIANEAYMKAEKQYDPTKSKFSTWIRKYVYWELLEVVRTNARKGSKLHRTDIDLDTMSSRKRFQLDQFLNDLSQDASKVVYLLIGGNVKNRNSLVSQLFNYGWEPTRIDETFREITSAISGI